MSNHQNVYGICENLCKVPVYAKSQTDDLLDEKANTSHTHTPSEVGLGNVNNTADANKHVNSAKFADSTQQAVLDTAGLRNVVFTDTEPTVGSQSQLPIGTIIAVYEE